MQPTINAADTAWMLVSTALVLLMIPGLALFYAGMVRAKNILATMMQSMIALGIVGTLWVTVGYAIAFGDDVGGMGLVGWSSDFVLLRGVAPSAVWPDTGVPIYVHAMFQGMFAIITPALISGALAERLRFSRWCLFVALWSVGVYAPLAHMVWHPKGWLFELGALDFAGGTVVHIAAGVSALVATRMLRARTGWPERPIHPSSAANTLLGAGLLWFGWFGFNGGSALAANAAAGLALTVTHVAASAGALCWTLVEWRKAGQPTAIGFASGAVAGLVGITPAAGFVGPGSAILIGVVSAVGCFYVVTSKQRLGLDDALDAFGVHGVGGAIGALLTGVLATGSLYGGDGGWLFDGKIAQVGVQALSIVATIAFAAPLTALMIYALGRESLVVDVRDEEAGLDAALHGERAWDLSEDAVVALDVVPRAAERPPVIVTLEIDVSGISTAALHARWSELCSVASEARSVALVALQPYVARLNGSTFRVVGLAPEEACALIERALPGCSATLAGEPIVHRSPREAGVALA
ncbi:MAG: ammonium transporter [Deltaproteobacteria bacterium]|nr:ammonium transporter [Deltaproteobacteria bacterium]